jgi:hypothetical protein
MQGQALRLGLAADQGTDPANSRARRDTLTSDPEASLPITPKGSFTMSETDMSTPFGALRQVDAKLPGKYEHRVVEGGIGHNLPQEAPQAFAQPVIDVAGF